MSAIPSHKTLITDFPPVKSTRTKFYEAEQDEKIKLASAGIAKPPLNTNDSVTPSEKTPLPNLTNLQAVKYSLEHAGVFLTLTNDKITLVDETGLYISNVVSTAAQCVEIMPDASSRTHNGTSMKYHLQLHVKGSIKDADTVSEMVTNLLTADNYNNPLKIKLQTAREEAEAYIALRSLRTSKQRFPWSKYDILLPPPQELKVPTYEEIKQEFLSKYPIEALSIQSPTSNHSNNQSDEGYTTSSSSSESPTTMIDTSPKINIPQNFVEACDAEETCNAKDEVSDDWDFIDNKDWETPSETKASSESSKTSELNPFLFADYKPQPLNNLVNVLNNTQPSSNYLSWNSENGQFTSNPIDKNDTKKLVFLKLEKTVFFAKGLYVEKKQAENILDQIKMDKFNHTALNALKKHLVSNDFKVPSKLSDVRV